MADPELSSVGDLRLGDWLVQPSLNRISRGDSTITLELKVMQVLVCLAEHEGDLVTRQQLTDSVWATEFISDNTVTHAITELRNAFGDDAKSPKYIETIHRRGYRLVAPVEWVGGDGGIGDVPAPARKPKWPYILAIGIAAVIALLVILPPEALFERGGEEKTEGQLPRIVVLPFENLGPPEDEYFADGITDELISRLTAVSGLQVISRTSAMYYKGKDVPLKQIGEELDVGFVLEGTIRWDRTADGHGRIRISPKLVRVDGDTQLWGERFDREIVDVFSVQSSIAENVVTRLSAAILDPERSGVEFQPTENFDAYQAYLSGMSHTYTENEERLQLAAEMFTRAIDLDPGFALAYAQLAEVRSSMVHYRIDLTSAADSAARNAALKAVELAPELAETHRSLGLYFYLSRREYDLALREFRLAQSLQRNDPEHLRALAIVLRRQGEWEHSCELMDEAIELDPLDWDLRFNQGVTHMFLRHYAKAANQMQRAIALKPERLQIYYWLAHVYRLWDGSGGRAESVLEKMPRSGHDMTVYAWLLQLLYEGDYERTLRLVRSIPKDTIGVRDQLIPPALVECECLLALDRVDEGRLACDEAVVALESDEDIQQEDPRLHSALAKTHALLGNKELAIGHARRAVELWPIGKDALDGCSFEVFLAEVDVTTGELESAIGILEYLLSIPSTVSVASLRHNPIWAPLRDNPRFQALLEKYDTELN